MGVPVVIQGEDGTYGHGGDGYGYTLADNLTKINELLGTDNLGEFVYVDPEDLEEMIEVYESIGQPTESLKAELERASKRPTWFSSEDGLKAVSRIEAFKDELALSKHDQKELDYDLNCYREILEGLIAKGQRFRLYFSD